MIKMILKNMYNPYSKLYRNLWFKILYEPFNDFNNSSSKFEGLIKMA